MNKQNQGLPDFGDSQIGLLSVDLSKAADGSRHGR